jgi:hypothetical protein
MFKRTIATILLVMLLGVLVFLIKNKYDIPNTLDDPGFTVATEAISPQHSDDDMNSDTTGGTWTGQTNVASASTDIKPKSSSFTPLNHQPSLMPAFRMLWNPLREELNNHFIEMLQIPKSEITTLQNAFIELQDRYRECMTLNGRLAWETDDSAKFIISSFNGEAQTANQDFLDKIQPHVSAATHDLMNEGMHMIVMMLGFNGGRQEITISKLPDGNKFRVDVKCDDANSREQGAYTWKSLSRTDIEILYGPLINNNGSNILK